MISLAIKTYNGIDCDFASYSVIKVLIILLYLQESHQERIGEDEFLFAEGEFDMDKLLVLVDFDNSALAELFVKYGAIYRQFL